MKIMRVGREYHLISKRTTLFRDRSFEKVLEHSKTIQGDAFPKIKDMYTRNSGFYTSQRSDTTPSLDCDQQTYCEAEGKYKMESWANPFGDE